MDLLKRIQDLNKNLIIREATPSDASGFTYIMNKQYSRKKDEKYFLWRFFSCPTPSTAFVITTKNNTIIGAYGVNIFTLTNGKRCGITADLIVANEYRHRGLFFLLENKINEFAKKNGCLYLLCLPNNIGMKTHIKVEGWQNLGPVSTLIYQLHQTRKTSLINTNILHKEVVSFKYNQSMLRWRFEENPEYRYMKLESGQCQCYIKIFTDELKNKFGDIVYYSSNYSKIPFFKLINKSINKLQALGAQKIITWCSKDSPQYSLFISLGFTPIFHPRYLCIKPLLPKEPILKLSNWNILPADSDVF